jgi:glycine/D-amino acid oxidase-like deaminating enzyme
LRTLVAWPRPVDLKSGYPYWAIKNGLLYDYPSLQGSLKTDVVIIGAGITGALMGEELASQGHSIVFLDEREVAWGSTAASTALLQYEIDTPLIELSELYGPSRALLAYRACVNAVHKLGRLAKSVRDVDYAPAESLFYASSRSDIEPLEHEYQARKDAGFDVKLLGQDVLEASYGLQAARGILSATAARVDPYRMASRLLARQARKGVQVFDRTQVEAIDPERDKVTVTTATGATVVAKHVVMAAGYACQKWLQASVAKNRSSYSFITDPLEPELLGTLSETLVWESARPYMYLRTTGDGRLLVGGEDDAIDVAAKRDASVASKVKRLQSKLKAAFPRLAVEAAFAWGGTFAETDDGLPYFGSHPDFGPRVHFAMSYGGNGITYSAIGAEIVRAAIEGTEHELSELFSFERARLKVNTQASASLADKLRAAVPEFLQKAFPSGE